MLSDYFPKLKDTPGDTEVYVMKGEKEGASALILGGTHANEMSSHMTAVLFIENAVPKEGTLYVVPRTNASGATHNDSQEGHPSEIHRRRRPVRSERSDMVPERPIRSISGPIRMSM